MNYALDIRWRWKRKGTMRVWSLKQLQKFETHAANDCLSVMWVLFMYRRGEVAGLQWSDVDLAAGS